MTGKKFFAVLAAMGLAFLAIAGGGCGGSSSKGANNRDQFIDALGYVADDLQSIADSAVSNRKIVTAIDDILKQYLISGADDSTLLDRVIGKTLTASDIVAQDFSGIGYDKGAYVQLWSNRHITVENNVVTSFEINQSDFQLTIKGSDHTTKLTVTPASETGYWKALVGASAVLNKLFGAQLNARLGEEHTYLLFVYVFASANVKVEYDSTKLLDGTLTLNYPGKTPDSMTSPVYENSPHTATFKFTLYPQDNKNYTVGFDFTRNVASSGANSISNTSDFSLYRKTGSSTGTLLAANAGLDITIPSGSVRASASSLKALDLNIANRIRLAESSSLNLLSLMGLYTTGTTASEETIKSNVEGINTLLSNAGLSLYLNRSATKAGDIRALAGKIGGYNHARLGIQFAGATEPELVKDIANPDDLQQLKTLLSTVSRQAQALAQLLTSIEGTGILGDVDVTGNEIIKLIFEDLFGTN